MDREKIGNHITKLLKTHQPVKARQLATILASEFGLHVDRSDVNSILYSLKSKGLVNQNSEFQWRLNGAGTNNISQPEEPVPSAEPEIHFTPEQEAIINLDPDSHLLIRGQAGSGKTTVLAARAGRILSAMNKGTVLFLTYNTALCSYVKDSFKKAGFKRDIDVRTFHDWAKKTSNELGADFSGWITSKDRAEQLPKLIEKAKLESGEHRFYDLKNSPELIEWWGAEIAWLFGQHVMRLDDYLGLERVGRGTATRVTQDDRPFIWNVYELYMEWLEETRQEDYDNPAGLILRTLMEQGQDSLPDNLRYDHLMIDEVQDFDKSWLMAAVKVPRISLSLAGDLAQKIYRRNFTWTSVGIQVAGGRSRRLNASHRTTKQIMKVAEYLLMNNDVINDADFTPPVEPTKEGEKVKLVMGSDSRDAYEKGYDWIAQNFKRLRTTSVAVAMPFNRQLYPAVKALEKRGVNARSVKGSSIGSFKGGVAVTTYHQLKGLEFDHVVIMGLHDAQFPGRLVEEVADEDKKAELDILSRLLFMVMTRAKQSLTLVGSEPFCRFFDNVPPDHLEMVMKTNKEKGFLERLKFKLG
jgi:superfamily I DNA/RNA helicase